jgi:phage FluMu gp28-like protein
MELHLKPDLYRKQREAIFDEARYVWVEASTKSGKTVGCLEWIVDGLQHDPPNANVWWVAPIYPQAKIAFTRLKNGLGGCEGITVNDSELRIEFPGKRSIWFKGSDKPDSLYGEDVYRCVMDEASRCREESWHAIRSTLTATQGPIRLIGNVKGRKNFFYRGCRAAQQGKAGHAYHKLTAQDAIDAGVLTADEVLDAEAALPAHVFRELYYAEPSDDGGNPFGLDAIDACIAPQSDDRPVCFGVDLAKSVDFNAVIGLDDSARVCRFAHWQSDWGATKTRLTEIVRFTPSLIDSTGVGDPIVEDLQRTAGNIEGFKFSSLSKQQLMEGLAAAIQRRQVSFPEGRIADELREFGYEYTRTGVRYSAPEGLHDDCVCALALAVKCYVDGGYGYIGELTAMTTGKKILEGYPA